jgi:hypothetical protein
MGMMMQAGPQDMPYYTNSAQLSVEFCDDPFKALKRHGCIHTPTIRSLTPKPMNISTFNDLLVAASQQTDAQRLLLVFAGAGLPDGATPEQRAAFEAGHSGELTPLMCVDKTPQEIGSFDALVAESTQFGHEWVIIFTAGMSGKGGQAPSSEEAQAHLQHMVEAIKSGQIEPFIPFNRQGDAVRLA